LSKVFRLPVLIATVVMSLAVCTGAQASIVTVGSPLTSAFVATEFSGTHPGTVIDSQLPEAGANVTSPISGTVIRWRTVDAAGGPLSLRVLRPAPASAYTAIATSSPATPVGSGTQVFSTALLIQAGDVIGLNNTNPTDKIGIINGEAGAAALIWESAIPDGATMAPEGELEGLEVAFDAEVQPIPGLSALSPSSGSLAGGTPVIITGHDFTGATAVKFGGTPATSFTVNSETQITAVAPPGTPRTAVDVTATTPGRNDFGARR
jgi:IPT/TIG domain